MAFMVTDDIDNGRQRARTKAANTRRTIGEIDVHVAVLVGEDFTMRYESGTVLVLGLGDGNLGGVMWTHTKRRPLTRMTSKRDMTGGHGNNLGTPEGRRRVLQCTVKKTQR